jgi:hypothetical protein
LGTTDEKRNISVVGEKTTFKLNTSALKQWMKQTIKFSFLFSSFQTKENRENATAKEKLLTFFEAEFRRRRRRACYHIMISFAKRDENFFNCHGEEVYSIINYVLLQLYVSFIVLLIHLTSCAFIRLFLKQKTENKGG